MFGSNAGISRTRSTAPLWSKSVSRMGMMSTKLNVLTTA